VNPEKFHFLFIGRWEPNKGPDILVEAFSRVAPKFPQAYLHVFGGGTLEDTIRSTVARHHLEENVKLYGYADPATVVAYMKACDALVIPSRIESIPIIFSDAVQVGIPVVATNVGDLGQLVRRYEVGVVVDPGDPDALAGAMGGMLGHQVAIATGAFQRAASAFGIEGMAKTYLNGVEGIRHAS